MVHHAERSFLCLCSSGIASPVSLGALSPSSGGEPPVFSPSAQPAACSSLLPADLGFFHRPEVGIVYHVFLPVPTA